MTHVTDLPPYVAHRPLFFFLPHPYLRGTAMPFPHFLYHREAKCFRCSRSLLDLSPTRNAPGKGHYRGHCKECNTFTWYDCAEGTVELIRVNEGAPPLYSVYGAGK